MTEKYKNLDFLKLSREIAYKGKIGRRREEFCVHYIRHKKDLIKRINNIQEDESKAADKLITCQKSCHYSSCCMEYVDATVQECEAIVYYLYHNESPLRLFLKNYPKWIQRVNEIEGISRTLEELSFDFDQRNMEQAGEKYYRKKIPCPFLDNNLCCIYEVRPYGCVGYYVTTPLSHCHPDYLDKVPVKRHLPHMETNSTAFYFRSLERPILVWMPKAVYGILEKGYFYLSTLPGLEGLEREAISDKKIRARYKKYTRSSETV